MKYISLFVIILGILCSGSKIYIPSKPPNLKHQLNKVSPKILWGLALNESNMNPNAISKDGMDRGLFQLRKIYDKLRGVINPFDPVESTHHAITILQNNYSIFHNTPKMLAAYRQGIGGVQKNGIDHGSKAYVKRIISAFNKRS
jgi:membrane-bound lytic murein transglycosylase MltF